MKAEGTMDIKEFGSAEAPKIALIPGSILHDCRHEGWRGHPDLMMQIFCTNMQ